MHFSCSTSSEIMWFETVANDQSANELTGNVETLTSVDPHQNANDENFPYILLSVSMKSTGRMRSAKTRVRKAAISSSNSSAAAKDAPITPSLHRTLSADVLPALDYLSRDSEPDFDPMPRVRRPSMPPRKLNSLSMVALCVVHFLLVFAVGLHNEWIWSTELLRLCNDTVESAV